MKQPHPHLIRLLQPLLSLLIVVVAVSYGQKSIEHEIGLLNEQASTGIKMGAQALSSQLEFISHDLAFLSQHSTTRAAIQHPTPANFDRLAEDFVTFAASHRHYAQIRWIDQHGMEQVRVSHTKGQPMRVPDEKLGNRAKYPFFITTMKLKPSDVFVSHLELSVDRNKVEIPYKPMIHIATPVSDAQGKPAGIIMLCYNGQALLHAFNLATARIADHRMLLNDEGYWLKSPHPNDEWGFMLQRPELRLAVRAPTAWAQIQARDSGQVELDDGLWTWETTYPLAVNQPKPPSPDQHHYFWKPVSHLPAEQLRDIRWMIHLKIGGSTVLLLVLLFLGYRLLSRMWQQLETAQTKYKTVAEFTLDWEVWITPEGRYEFCSPSCQDITGYPAAEFLANPKLLFSITHPEDLNLLQNHQSDIKFAYSPCRLTFRIIHKNGEIRWLEHVCQPVFSPSGEFLGRRASNRDVTEQKNAAEAQEDQARNVHALLNTIQESAFLMERNGTLLVINEVGAHRLNTTPNALIGKNMFELLPPDIATARRAHLEEIAALKQSTVYEDERGGYRFLNRIFPIQNNQGAVTRFAVYATDITLQYRQQAIDAMLSTINQDILQGMPLHAVLTDGCQKLADLFDLDVVWIGQKEADGSVEILAAAGLAVRYVDQLKTKGIRWDDSPQGHGPTGTAIRSERVQWYKVDDPKFQTWADIARSNHLATILAIPLRLRGQVYGAFTLYSQHLHFFDAPELRELIHEISQQLASALEFATDQQQIRLLSSALEIVGNGIFITDQHGLIQWANPAFTKLCGYELAELLQHTPRLLKSGQQSDEYYRELWATILNGERWESEAVERAKNGHLYTVSQTITPLRTNGEITHFIAIHQDISAQKQSQERIAHLAHYDTLTGLPNRALFYDRLHQAVLLAQRSGGNLALLYMDLDGFKQVNDTLGHHAGDALLQVVAKRLSRGVRASDTVARLGGDEFTIILNATHPNEDLSNIAEKIIQSISHPIHLDGRAVHVGISIGIARYSEEADSEDELVRLADQAMYAAKLAGKNTYRISQKAQDAQ